MKNLHETHSSTPTPMPLADGRTLHFLGFDSAPTTGLLTRVAAEIDSAVAAVVSFWGDDWSREVVIAGADSAAQFTAWTRWPSGPQWVDVAAAAVADTVDPARRIATGQRMVFAPGAARMSDAALRIVLRHELLHYATRADTALDAPRWLAEGVADFVGRPAAPKPGPAAADTLAQLPAEADFNGVGSAQSLAYDRAWWFARFIADRYGTATLKQLYIRAGGAAHLNSAAALRDVLGVEEGQLFSVWRRWLAR
ncbi:hypothetical protein [Mycolicibacterium sarraceniae]|uniref:hypothetical protein n=1 Tax=Mycolicibacterium sarraceniae TaxID=1534348 RepID=UPI0013D1D357|nr:hypothetical protein [Mycolicibacterium sarraceniae]